MQKGRIYKRGPSWYASITINGEQLRKSAGPSKVEARRLLEQLRRSEANARPYASLRDVLLDYVASLRLRAKPRSVAQVQVQVGTILAHFGQSFDAADLGPRELDKFIGERLQAVKPASLNSTLRVLRAALNHALEHELLDHLPVRVKLLKAPQRIPRILASREVERLLAHAREPFDAIILIAAVAGLRHDEILRLWVRDVNLTAMELHVSVKPGWSPKSHAERVVPTTRRLADRLARHIASLENQSPEAWLFPSYEGGPYTSVARQVRAAFAAAGLHDPDAKPGLHQLRRSWASSMLGNGADVETVRELGGWADLATVQRYLSSTDERKRRAVESVLG